MFNMQNRGDHCCFMWALLIVYVKHEHQHCVIDRYHQSKYLNGRNLMCLSIFRFVMMNGMLYHKMLWVKERMGIFTYCCLLIVKAVNIHAFNTSQTCSNHI
ncbi:hypothetical protein PR048_011119 [Dryococelus australis]|uniref:Uncharacterized protein n=1 Tax=Dryococelus australis TaxID=614101 RepID=A0ABQ9HKN8_9NEOP|nr:hypothetical protein PR048_011119 [Dryococelus australis]